MTTFETGRRAEDVAADFLERKGCTIIARNWRTPRCEIDIIAERQQIIYFCEVKYRATTVFGRGLEYITPQKLRQMRFAANLWVAYKKWTGDYQLCAIEVSGPLFRVTGAATNL